jgi:hypothetical protein
LQKIKKYLDDSFFRINIKTIITNDEMSGANSSKKLLQRKEEKLSVMGRKIMGKEEHSK